LQRTCNISIERRQIRRRLCATGEESSFERSGELVKLNLIRVSLSGVDPRMAHQPFEGRNVTAALTHKSVGEAMSQLMRGELSHTGLVSVMPDH
jgi:hypothetical protein